jgi:hypothetical protein
MSLFLGKQASSLNVRMSRFLEQFVRDKPLLEDHNMRGLWTRFEQFLVRQFPTAERLVPSHDKIDG